MTTTKQDAAATIDMDLVKRMIEANPAAFAPLLEEMSPPRQDREFLKDKYDRAIRVTDKVVTPAGEAGMVIRLDMNSRRVLIRLDKPADETRPTRMLMAHRVEVKRGRPRKLAVAV